MNWRELSLSEFYEERDKRTALEVEFDARLNSGVRISIDADEAASFEGQITFLELINVTARWCRMIQIEAPDCPVHPRLAPAFSGETLLLAGVENSKRCDPFGEFTPENPSWVPVAHVHVGCFETGGLGIQGRGWLASTGDGRSRLQSSSPNLNPLGAVLAACLGANHLLRSCLRHRGLPLSTTVSLWNFETDADALDGPSLNLEELGRTAIVGVGAIGCGIVQLIPLLDLRFASLTLIDKDLVEISNLNRVPIFHVDDLNHPKVEVARDYLKGWSIECDIKRDWYSDNALSLDSLDLVIPAANEHGFQQRLMANTPPLMIAASTGDDWTAYMQRHIPLKDDCLECRIPTSESDEPAFVCATGELGSATELASETPGLQKTGAIPFLPLAGSVLAASELAKLALGVVNSGAPNYASLCFRTEEYVLQGTHRKPKARCVHCWNDAVFKKLRSAGKYSFLSD